MAQTTNADHYRLRAIQEREAAAREPRPEIRRIHLDLASRYAELLQAAERSTDGGVAPD